jgi:hypothetical protein
MELFIPGLIVFVLVAFFIFLILPRMGPMVLAVASLLALVAAGIHHYTFFSSEYALSTWQYGLASYAPFLVLGLAILFIISALMFVFGGGAVPEAIATPMQQIQEAVVNSVNAMPPANTATNPLTAAINTGLNAIGIGNSTNVNKGGNARPPNARPPNAPKPANGGIAGLFTPPIPGTNIRPSQI